MKKLLMLSVAALTLTAMPALAEHHEGMDGKRGDMFTKQDTNADGMISKDEFLAHATTKFNELDANKDGNISKAESDAKKAEWKARMKEHREKMKDKMMEEHADDASPDTAE